MINFIINAIILISLSTILIVGAHEYYTDDKFVEKICLDKLGDRKAFNRCLID